MYICGAEIDEIGGRRIIDAGFIVSVQRRDGGPINNIIAVCCIVDGFRRPERQPTGILPATLTNRGWTS
jgi:hypothetical protein